MILNILIFCCMRQIYLLLSCTFLLLCACEFSPTGDHYEEVDPKPVNNISINLNSTADTFFVSGDLSLVLRLELPGKHLRGYQMLLDGEVIKEGNQQDIHVILRTSQFADGPHEIKVIVESSTGTNSLADKGGYEYIQVYRSWVLMLDNAPATPVKFTKLAVENGTLELAWEKYPRRHINHYNLSRRTSSGGVLYSLLLPPNITTFTDHSYQGGDGYYSVDVVDGQGHYTLGQVTPVRYSTPKLLSYKYVNGSDLQLTFSASRLYQNFGKYSLVSADEQPLSFETTSITDTVVTLQNVPFGADFNLLLTTVPKDQAHREYGNATWFTVKGYGKENSIGPYSISHYNPQNNLLYDFRSASLSAFDPQTLQLKHSLPLNVHYSRTLSTNGRYLYMYDHPGVLLQLNPVTFQTIARYDLFKLLPGLNFAELLLQVGNNNKLLVYARHYSDEETLYVLDMNTQRLELTHVQSSADRPVYSISPEGKMVTASDYKFRLQQDGTWQKTQVPPYSIALIIYHPAAPLYLLGGRSTVTLYSTENNAAIKTIVLGQGVYPDYIDQATGYLVASGNQRLYIYDLEQHRMLKEINIAPNETGYVFLKDKLFTLDYYTPILF